jgi:hypothetical protein
VGRKNKELLGGWIPIVEERCPVCPTFSINGHFIECSTVDMAGPSTKDIKTKDTIIA